MSNETDVIDILTSDHREVLELIGEIHASSSAEKRRDLADIVIAELVRHSVAEEMHVYPAMREYLPDGDAAADHDTQEHKELEATMKQLEGLAGDSAEFQVALTDMETQLRHHVTEEEGEHFPLLRQHVPAEELQSLAERVQLTKKVAPTRPHPASPNNALFHATVGPGVGLVDRLRDKLSGRSNSR